jgi:DNA mismatch repair protein MutS2
MAPKVAVGDAVQTPLGKGVVREVRGARWVLVEINGRAVVLEERTIGPIDSRMTARAKKQNAMAFSESRAPEPSSRSRPAAAEVDLHGLTVQEALARIETAVNDALLGDAAELRVIHGQSGGRIRGALHTWLRHVSSVRAFSIDPRNPGVTIVRF